LKNFIPKTKGRIANIRQEAVQIYEIFSSFQAYYLGVKNTVQAHMNEVKQYLKLKAPLEGRIPTKDVVSNRTTLLDKFREARAFIEMIDA